MSNIIDGADENGDVKQAGLDDSNMANYGSKEHIEARKKAAQSEKEFVGAGQRVGLEIWRVENRRTKADTPDFGVKRWPREDYGSFYSDDSYLVLNTYKDKESDKLLWDVHFWLGKESSQDEIGVAAYKAVELDDLLDDGPVQHREVQGHESALFQSYFKGIQYMEGGIASGFRHVKPEEYKPRLFQVRRTRKTVRAFEVPVKASSLNHGDVFILDAGLQIYSFIGEQSNAFEKMKGGALAHNLVSARQGKSKLVTETSDEFWRILGGSPKDVKTSEDHDEDQADKPVELDKCKLYRLSDSAGSLQFKKEFEGRLSKQMLDSNDAFIIDAGIELFVWIGKNASQKEKSYAMKNAMEYLQREGKPLTTPITRVVEGQIHHVFGAIVKG
jgi:gelsolin